MLFTPIGQMQCSSPPPLGRSLPWWPPPTGEECGMMTPQPHPPPWEVILCDDPNDSYKVDYKIKGLIKKMILKEVNLFTTCILQTTTFFLSRPTASALSKLVKKISSSYIYYRSFCNFHFRTLHRHAEFHPFCWHQMLGQNSWKFSLQKSFSRINVLHTTAGLCANNSHFLPIFRQE